MLEIAAEAYRLTSELPEEERFGLISQIRRASVSISSNIAEGASRSFENDFCRFIEIAIGSGFEVKSQLLLCNKLGFLKPDNLKSIEAKLEVLLKQLNSLRSKLKDS